MTRVLSVTIFITIFLIACKPKTPDINNSSNPPQTYLPNTIGSSWKYQLNFLVPSVKEVHVTGRDTTFSNAPGLTFNIMDAKSAGYEYQARVNNDYYITVPASANNTPYKVIKGDAVLGEQWLGAINGTDTYFVKLLEQDLNYKIDTITFPKTLHIQQTRKTKSGSTDMSLDTWVAYGVGIVKSKGVITNFPYESTIIAADIK